MSRFSVEANMQYQNQQLTQSNITQQNSQQPQTSLMLPQLNFPSEFNKPTVALDRDGVLCECAEVISRGDQFVPIKDSFRAVAIIRSLGHKVVVLFDQPGISRKKITIPEVETMNQHMLNLLGQAGCISIDGMFYSISDKKRDVYAKPNLGMFNHAESMLSGVKLRGGYYVGDDIDDLVMANNAGATPVLVLTGKGEKTIRTLDKPIYKLLKPKVKVFANLMEFAKSIS